MVYCHRTCVKKYETADIDIQNVVCWLDSFSGYYSGQDDHGPPHRDVNAHINVGLTHVYQVRTLYRELT